VKASLQSRLLISVLGMALAVWLLAAAWTWIGAQHELDELLDGHLAQAAALVISQQGSTGHPTGEHDDHADEHASDDALAPTLHRYAPRVAFQVWHDGQLLTRSGNAPAQPLAPHTRGFGTVQIDGAAWRVFAAPGRAPDMQVWVGERLDARASILHAVLRGQLAPLALALPLLALAGWGVAQAMGLGVGGTVLMMTLAGSASYIAAPTAMRIAVPEANPALGVAAALAVTFPFNLLLGIPLYLWWAQAMAGA